MDELVHLRNNYMTAIISGFHCWLTVSWRCLSPYGKGSLGGKIQPLNQLSTVTLILLILQLISVQKGEIFS